MERFVYLDGRFFDRVSNSAAQMAHSLDAEIVTVKRERRAGFGLCERVELRSRSQRGLPEIVKRAMLKTVVDIGQLSADEVKTLNQYVRKGYLSTGKGGGYPVLKRVWAFPGYDFDGAREAAINALVSDCEAVGEKVKITFERRAQRARAGKE